MNGEVYEYYYKRVGEVRQKKADRLKLPEDKARSVGAGSVLVGSVAAGAAPQAAKPLSAIRGQRLRASSCFHVFTI